MNINNNKSTYDVSIICINCRAIEDVSIPTKTSVRAFLKDRECFNCELKELEMMDRSDKMGQIYDDLSNVMDEINDIKTSESSY